MLLEGREEALRDRTKKAAWKTVRLKDSSISLCRKRFCAFLSRNTPGLESTAWQEALHDRTKRLRVRLRRIQRCLSISSNRVHKSPRVACECRPISDCRFFPWPKWRLHSQATSGKPVCMVDSFLQLKPSPYMCCMFLLLVKASTLPFLAVRVLF